MSARLTDDAISTSRLISFSDGVFAIAVTLLVFNIKVPQIAAADVHRLLPGMIRAMLPGFTTYVLSFLLIAVYWTFHHRMLNLITRMDTPFLWMNIFYLLTISFIPFPAALFGNYPRETFSFIFYISSMILVNGITMLMLTYASYKYRLITKNLSINVIKYIFFRQLTTIFVFLLAIPIAIFHLQWAVYFLFILFPVHWGTRKYFSKLAEK
jgi:uncharacterized membrane protein